MPRSSFTPDRTTMVLGLATLVFAGIALAAPSPIKPNVAGYRDCIKLHPDRFCRIDNGFSVPDLAKAP